MRGASDLIEAAAAWTLLVVFDIVVAALVPLVLLAPFLLAAAVGPWSLRSMLDVAGLLAMGSAAVGTVPVLAAQVWYGHRAAIDRVKGSFGLTAAIAADTSVQERVKRLSAVAGRRPPLTEVLDSDEPNSFAVGAGKTARIYVTRGLLERLDGEELDAVLAHELAHLQNRDTTLLTAAQFVPATTGRWLGTYADAAMLSESADVDGAAGGGARGIFFYLMPVIPVVAVARVVSLVSLRLLARSRERAADRAAARLCGSPTALATVLEAIDGTDRPHTDARFDAAHVRELCLLDGDSGETIPSTRGWVPVARRYWRRFESWLAPAAHPETATRVERLRELTAAAKS
ncbi:M48 family metalloprotease [Halapricum sp. CBA1109]|uniref:M48 family metallopeptidase n=1 Tax=Halapricum sp. CBA1109 TaxID=2668068 RepID=UPI0012F94EB1|nr:M56 family metallopeptidase [Halapricum sp. CBA1109]MUV90400.1 M48 family metalloprotease [Halapricum sp. CBA1109]